MYNSSEENTSIRYLETHCEAGNQILCKCGDFVMSVEKPYKLAYIKIATINKVKQKSIMVYDWKIDKEYQF